MSAKVPGFWRRDGFVLRPDSDVAQETLSKIPNAGVVQADVRLPRNIGHHRRYWALCSLVANNSSLTREQVDALFKRVTENGQWVESQRFGKVWIAGSISFAKMDQIAFSRFWDQVCDFIASDLIPGIQQEDIQREIWEMVK